MIARWMATLGLGFASACTEPTIVETPTRPRIELARDAGGGLAVRLRSLAEAPAALELELEITAGAGYELFATPPAGQAIDTLKVHMNGLNRATLFAADKRGATLTRDGPVALLEARPTGARDDAATLAIRRALVASTTAEPIEVELGAPLPLH